MRSSPLPCSGGSPRLEASSIAVPGDGTAGPGRPADREGGVEDRPAAARPAGGSPRRSAQRTRRREVARAGRVHGLDVGTAGARSSSPSTTATAPSAPQVTTAVGTRLGELARGVLRRCRAPVSCARLAAVDEQRPGAAQVARRAARRTRARRRRRRSRRRGTPSGTRSSWSRLTTTARGSKALDVAARVRAPGLEGDHRALAAERHDDGHGRAAGAARRSAMPSRVERLADEVAREVAGRAAPRARPSGRAGRRRSP